MMEKFKEYLVPLSILGAGVVVAASILFLGQKSGLVGPANQALAPEENQFQIIDQAVGVEGDPVLGNPDAKLTMIEFSDFQCSFCKRHHEQTFPELKAKYFDPGLVKLIFKDFPLAFHENAQPAAEAGQCAFEQGKFWEYQDKLFENQEKLDKTSLKKYAGEIDLNQARFDSCLDSGKYRQRVNDDAALGQKIGVKGTTSFLIGDTLVDGAYPFAAFEKVIEEKLKEL